MIMAVQGWAVETCMFYGGRGGERTGRPARKHWLESLRSLPLPVPFGDEAAVVAFATQAPCTGLLQHIQVLEVLGHRGIVFRGPRGEVVAGGLHLVDRCARFDLSELNKQDQNQCTRSKSFRTIAIV